MCVFITESLRNFIMFVVINQSIADTNSKEKTSQLRFTEKGKEKKNAPRCSSYNLILRSVFLFLQTVTLTSYANKIARLLESFNLLSC
jgi:hypothetical protein